jgi:hypothetical protein
MPACRHSPWVLPAAVAESIEPSQVKLSRACRIAVFLREDRCFSWMVAAKILYGANTIVRKRQLAAGFLILTGPTEPAVCSGSAGNRWKPDKFEFQIKTPSASGWNRYTRPIRPVPGRLTRKTELVENLTCFQF